MEILQQIFARISKRAGTLQCLERLSLTPTHSLHLVKVGDESLLIAASPSGCEVIRSVGVCACRVGNHPDTRSFQ